jgi:DNA-directed RNA polymerase II subunit RPB1
MGGAFVESQYIETFGVSDITGLASQTQPVASYQVHFKSAPTTSSAELQALLGEESSQLIEDRRLLRSTIFTHADSKESHSSPVNLHCITQNAKQIFPIDLRKPSDLEPAHIVQSVKDLGERLIVVPGNDPLSRESQDSATLTFRMHLRAKFNQSLANPGEMCGTLAAQSLVFLV